ncbi:MAG: mannose-1-phosphate guanylyltransferase [Candidatus Dormibacteria bacterium]
MTVVLAGGSGTRLWPRSRAREPKHLGPLAPDGRSLLRHAYERADRLGGEVLVVTAEDQAERVLAELPELGRERLLREPQPRGTGPALAWAALAAQELHRDPVLVSLHADHFMPDVDATTFALLSAALWASRAEVLVALGVEPRYASAGFGYVKSGPELARPRGLESALPLRQGLGFVEKPDLQRAAEMVQAGGYLWNTGLFAWSAALFLDELERYAPEVAHAVRGATKEPGDQFAAAWGEVPMGVVDRLVLERSRLVAVLPAPIAWSDLGSFRDLHHAAVAVGGADGEGNVVRGEALLLDSRGSYVDSASGRLVVLLGGEELVVVDTEDVVLVCPLARAQEVNQVVAALRQRGRSQLL